ncbi:hypothetical protein [Lacticaseibacillus yichunensis]|uniref:Peptidase S74 domain-containing protein n=1 Tax=Lacticaseibacillus yichunensis TaxID=2486015 RepID=A0ABW4CLK8_9LACO|nr:hypothetical protein [Lacticaseibacillus yichunensis]
MLLKPQAVHDAWAATQRVLDVKVKIGTTTYTATDVTSLSYDSGAMNGEALTLGSTYTNTIKISFSHLVEGLQLLDEITPQIGIQLPDGTWDFTDLGVFVIDSEVQQDRNNNTTTVSASDRMCMLGGTYTSKLTYPAAISDIAIEIANMAGVKVNEDDFARIPTTRVVALDGMTYRDAVGYVAQFVGGFATFDREGLLDIRLLNDSNLVISPSQYQSMGLTKNEAPYRIGGIQCTVTTTTTDDSGNESQNSITLQSGSSSGTQIVFTNPGMNQTLLDLLYEQLQDLNFYPFTLNWFGDPTLEAGDWVTLQDTAGNEFKTPNLLYSMTFSGGLTATSKADTTVTASANFVYRGQLSQFVENVRQYINAAGHVVSEGIDEPSHPKIGDIWFKKDGPDTTIMTYVVDPDTQIGLWSEGPSTKPNEQLQADLVRTQSETEAAKTAADAAMKAANDAATETNSVNQATQSQISLLQNDINLRVTKDGLLDQINIAAGKTLIQSSGSIYLDASTVAFSGAAFIPDAAISSLSADKLTAGTIDAADINVVNINASAITTGILSGANISMNLNTGEVLFQKGSIKSTDGHLDIEINNGTFSQTDATGNGFIAKEGGLTFTNGATMLSESAPAYGSLGYNSAYLNSLPGLWIRGKLSAVISTQDYSDWDPFNDFMGGDGAVIAASSIGSIMYSSQKSVIYGGNRFNVYGGTNRPFIWVGSTSTSTSSFGIQVDNTTGSPGNEIGIHAKAVVLNAENVNDKTPLTGDLVVATDSRSGYVRSTSTYNRTYSGSSNMVITSNGVLGRVTSARKYKLMDEDAEDVISVAKNILNINPKSWYDKAEVETIAAAETQGNELGSDYQLKKYYGFIADDFAAAGLTQVVEYRDGEVDSLDYDRIPMYHNVILSDHEKRIRTLEDENKLLKEQIHKLMAA